MSIRMLFVFDTDGAYRGTLRTAARAYDIDVHGVCERMYARL